MIQKIMALLYFIAGLVIVMGSFFCNSISGFWFFAGALMMIFGFISYD